MANLGGILTGLGIFAILMGLVQWKWPAPKGPRRSIRGFFREILWWPVAGFMSRITRPLFVGGALLLPAVALGRERFMDHMEHGAGPLKELPFALQLLIGLLCADFLGYWIHRLFHKSKRLWRLHAIHHSSKTVDWLAAARGHPIGTGLGTVLRVIPLFLMGLPLKAFAVYAPLFLIHGIVLHASVPWRFGPLRYVIASPAFHRFHHQKDLHVNFAGFFPIWDLIFRTYHLPAGEQPTEFGVKEDLPEGIFPLLAAPFRPWPEAAPAAPAKKP